MSETEQQTQSKAEIESTFLSLQATAKRCGYQTLDQIPNTPQARSTFRKEFWERLRIPGIREEELQTMYFSNFFNAFENAQKTPELSPSLPKIFTFFGILPTDITDLEDVKRLFVTGEKPKGQIEREQKEEKKRTEAKFKGTPWTTEPGWERIKKDETIFSLEEAKRISEELWQKFDAVPENKTSLVPTLAFGLQMAADFARQREKGTSSNIYQAIPAIPVIELIRRLNNLIGQEEPEKLATEVFKKEKVFLLYHLLDMPPEVIQKAFQENREVDEHALRKMNSRARTIRAILHQDRQWIKEQKEEPGGKFLADFLAYFNGELDKLKRNKGQNSTRA